MAWRNQEKRAFRKKFVEEIEEPLYFDIHELGDLLGKSTPKFDTIIENLKQKGFKASRSSLCPTGIKTNAGIKDLVKIF